VILHVGNSVISTFNGSFSTECAVRSPSRRDATILDDMAITSAVLFRDRMIVNDLSPVK
jgi:hypothetical protein